MPYKVSEASEEALGLFGYCMTEIDNIKYRFYPEKRYGSINWEEDDEMIVTIIYFTSKITRTELRLKKDGTIKQTDYNRIKFKLKKTETEYPYPRLEDHPYLKIAMEKLGIEKLKPPKRPTR